MDNDIVLNANTTIGQKLVNQGPIDYSSMFSCFESVQKRGNKIQPWLDRVYLIGHHGRSSAKLGIFFVRRNNIPLSIGKLTAFVMHITPQMMTQTMWIK